MKMNTLEQLLRNQVAIMETLESMLMKETNNASRVDDLNREISRSVVIVAALRSRAEAGLDKERKI